jgi:DNA adenine methylase
MRLRHLVIANDRTEVILKLSSPLNFSTHDGGYMSQREKQAIPLLRWAGSKRKLVPKLLPFWGASHSRYVEPFAGSAALFYAIAPKRALLSDINSELIQALSIVRDHPAEVYNRLKALPTGKRSYYRLRALSTSEMSEVSKAARFLFLNRFCFNGLYRTNLAGSFNVPYSPSGTGGVPAWYQFHASARQLQSAVIRQGDFAHILSEEVQDGDFVYLDPPYAVANRRIFRQYGPQTFGLDDLERLVGCLHAIDAIGASFVLSYAYCAEAVFMFRDWRCQKLFAQRNISGFAKHRRTAAELLVTNL